jgi:5-methylcytosine-specific restriction enzyme subunit McrC
MTALPVLIEYESLTVRLSDRQARQLHASGAVVVAPGAGDGEWRVTAQNLVGSLQVDDIHLLIRPKIRPDNLFLLLEVGLPESAWRPEAAEYQTTGDLLPAVVAFFARTVESTLARGVIRSYRDEREWRVALRGRVDLPRQFSRAGVMIPVACRYDDYTADIVENRYLKVAIRRALRVPGVHAVDRRRLMQHLVALDDVTDMAMAADQLDRLTVNRLNQHYLPALRLARLLLDNLTLVDQRGGTVASSFLLDMNKLFERFVTERLRQALVGHLEVHDQTTAHLGTGRQVRMTPDLEFRHRGRTVYVADIKYKLTADATARNSDHYQLLAYCTAFDLPEGVLIYCLKEGGRLERSVTVRHAGKVLQTRAIDLSGPAASVDAEMALLADWLLHRSSSSWSSSP